MNLATRAMLSILGLCLIASPAHAVASKTLIAPPGSASEELGGSVANAGDVNGDGYPDVIVGANDWAVASGRAFVYFGGPAADEVPDLTLYGSAGQERFGVSVSGAGDVNGDGYADVIVGAYVSDSVASNAGRAYIFHGGPTPDVTADLIIQGAAMDDRLGIAVSGAGDVNGDGFADVVVGADQFGGATSIGEAYLFYGGPGMDAVADLTMQGEFFGSRFGSAVSGAGDVNGDGYADFIVGSQSYVGNTGRAYLYLGGPSLGAVADQTFTGPSSGSRLGAAVSGAGDVNLDGYDDLLVGAWAAGPSGEGQAFVYYGGASPNNIADVTLTGEVGGDQFGSPCSGAGDVNGDGYDDVIVGAQGNDAYGTNTGRAYVFLGGPVGDTLADIVYSGETDLELLGNAVSGAGDLTGDGFPDLIVGARNYGGGDGRAYVYDINRFHILSPDGGENWPVGSTQSISWLGEDPADLWLSIDGGFTFEKLRTEVGGSAQNSVPLLVPHVPTRFAVVKATAAFQVGGYSAQSTLFNHGEDQSDSLFTIQSSVALLTFTVAARPGGGAELAWASEPAVGPQGIAGYRLHRGTQQIGPSLITGTSYIDDFGTPGSTYRLTAVNGLGAEIQLGSGLLAKNAPLAAWPQPYRGGVLNVSFAAGNAFGGGAGQVDVSLYDAAGRRIRTLESGTFAPGYHTTTWNGLDGEGRRVPGGIYFLNLRVEGQARQMKVVVAP